MRSHSGHRNRIKFPKLIQNKIMNMILFVFYHSLKSMNSFNSMRSCSGFPLFSGDTNIHEASED